MKSVTLMAIAGILVGSYLGGKMTSTGVVEYEYAEVYNAVGQCEEGTFMGGCSDCKECKTFEYNAGGCSYFKDTLCVLCENIKHCATTTNENDQTVPAITCTDSYDQTCSVCENGYWDEDCKPCKVCPEGSYETVMCTQSSNTECAECTECDEDEYLSKACTYTSDSECTVATVCVPGTWSSYVKGSFVNVYTVIADTACSPCSEPREGQFVTDLCTIVSDTKFGECGDCAPREEYISDDCDAGTWNALGEDITCSDCSEQAGDQYTVWHCDSTGYKDSLHADCSDCQDGEYLFAECSASADTVCPDCTAIENCGEGSVRCEDSTDSTCVECSDGFYGDTCCYEKQYSACGSMTTRERRADQYGYEGNSNEEFITFCLELCDEFPDCMAFEVEDGGEWYMQSGDNALSTKGAKCHFKSSFTQLTNDFTQDCYSNICRQGENFLDFSQYEEEGLLDQAKALVHSHKNGKNH